MTSVAEENKEIAIKFFEALSAGSETYLDFYNDDSIIWTAGDNAIGGTRTKKEIIDFKEAIIFAFLGVLKLEDKTNCLSSVTGAKRDCSGGDIYIK